MSYLSYIFLTLLCRKEQGRVMENMLSTYLCYMRIEKYASPHSLYSYRYHLEKFINHLRQCSIDSFDHCTLSIIREYVYTTRDSRNLSANSIRLIISVLKSFFNYLSDENLISSNPTRKIKLPKKVAPVPKAIAKFEIERILNAINISPLRCQKNKIRDRLIISMLYYTGIRKSELLALDWNDIDLGKSVLTIRSGKGRKSRQIPIHPKLQNLLDLYLEQRLPLDNYALFIGEQGKRLNKNSFANILKMYLSISGLEKKGYSAHKFRVSFATHLAESGVDIFTVQDLLGHSCLDTTKAYVSCSRQKMVSAVESL